ncbi:unnamed protein product, partial [Iphiclides podalirius]
MMLLYLGFIIKISLFWIHTVKSMSVINKHTYFMDNGDAENEVADLIAAKSYIPDERDLPKATVIKNVDNDATYFLSKLSDEQLMKLLSEQPKKNEYYLSDIINLTVGNRPKEENKVMANMDNQLKVVMTRITNELSKSEYIPLLQQLSEVLLPRLIDSKWFSADSPCDEEAELTSLELASQQLLSSIGQQYMKRAPLGKSDPEPMEEEADTDEEEGNDETDESEESHDEDEEEELQTYSPARNNNELEPDSLDEINEAPDLNASDQSALWPIQ